MMRSLDQTMDELGAAQWLRDADWLRDKRAIKVAACESHGENAVDLMLAIYFATLDCGCSLNLNCFDDQRDPHAAAALAEGLAANGTQVVIGHFAATAALSARRIYDCHPMLFLAPGCSDPGLCSSSAPDTHAVRFFGNDDEQADCLLAAIPAGARVRIFAQRGNYGYRLGKVLHQRLSAHASSANIDFLNAEGGHCRSREIDADLVLVAGSCEFAKRVADTLILTSEQTLLFSDDCRMDVAVKLKTLARTSVAALDCDLESPGQARFSALMDRAVALAGRQPGPYFLTSYLACQALCKAMQEIPDNSPGLLRTAILNQRFASPYGMLEFDSVGNLCGHRWILNTVPAQRQDAREGEIVATLV